jgi:hypothetical protein
MLDGQYNKSDAEHWGDKYDFKLPVNYVDQFIIEIQDIYADSRT